MNVNGDSLIRDRPLENLSGGGEGGREKYKNIFAQGKIKLKKFLHANLS